MDFTQLFLLTRFRLGDPPRHSLGWIRWSVETTSVLVCSIGLALAVNLMVAVNSSSAQEWHPKLTEVWEPVPPIVTPGAGTAAPSDAIVLFDGAGLSAWENVQGGDAAWIVAPGALTVSPGTGDIRTRGVFGDVQLHIEWRTPAKVEGEGQGRGNSGVFFHETYEVQILDSFENVTYSNGQAGSIYKQNMPMVNASKGPGEWQTYDIVFQSPVFAEDGDLIRPAFVTVLQNGVLVQNHVEIKGHTAYIGLPNTFLMEKGPSDCRITAIR